MKLITRREAINLLLPWRGYSDRGKIVRLSAKDVDDLEVVDINELIDARLRQLGLID